MTVSDRRMTATCGARNNSILSVTDLGEPHVLEDIDLVALQRAVAWLLDYHAAGLPAQSIVNFWLWYNPSKAYNSMWETDSYVTLQSLLSFFLWRFTANNNGNPDVAKEAMDTLPDAFRTTASLSEPYTRFVLNTTAFTIYIALQTLVLVLCWAVFFWQVFSGRRLQPISSFPQVDFANKLHTTSHGDDPLSTSLRRFLSSNMSDSQTMQALKVIRVAVDRHCYGNPAPTTEDIASQDIPEALELPQTGGAHLGLRNSEE
ncbi:hypothetical protein MBLNU13_g01137t1 [Cladosporium sp. NU13]